MFGNLTVKARLAATIGFLVLALGGISALGLIGMSRSNEALKTVYEDRTVALNYLGQVDRGLAAMRLSITNAIIEGNGETLKANVARARSNYEIVNKAWRDYA